jgi:hypothetical protein
MARKSHPAISLDPKDLANQPFMVMPTAASASAAVDNRIGATWRRVGAPGSAKGNVTVDGSVTGGSVIAESAGKNSGGISISDDRSASAEVVAAAFCRLRGREGLARSAPVSAFFLGGT